MNFAASVHAVTHKEHEAAGEWRVLLVHDNDLFRTALAESLRDDGHIVLEYAAPLHLPPLPSLPQVHVVITDCEPLDPVGTAFLRAFHTQQPDTPIVLVTSWPPHDLSISGVAPTCLRLLVKPVRYEDVYAMLRTLAATQPPFSTRS
jgi:DNA-binding NtrC family response regulator